MKRIFPVSYTHLEPERRLQMDWWENEETYDGPVMECLEELKAKGIVKYTGVAGTCTHELAKIMDTGHFDCVLTAFNYSLLWREAEYEILPVAKKHNMGVICGSPLQQGSLAVRRDDIIENGAPWISTPRKEQFKALYRLLDETGMDIIEMSMRFVAVSYTHLRNFLIFPRKISLPLHVPLQAPQLPGVWWKIYQKKSFNPPRSFM